MKRLYIKLLILTVLPLFMALSRDVISELVFTDIPERLLNNIKKITLPNGKTAYAVRDISYYDDIDLTTDMLVSFDRAASSTSRDDTGRYSFYSAEYKLAEDNTAIGRGCASFFKRDHGVAVVTSPGVWLGSCGDLGSFTIEMRYKLNGNGDGTLFSRVGYFSGIKKGIEIKVINGVPAAFFFNMFREDNGRLRSVSLIKGKKSITGSWHHLSISFDRMTGRLVKHIDAAEEDVAWITATGRPCESVLVPSFGDFQSGGGFKCSDLPMAFIGKDFNGQIDEFRISYAGIEELEKSKDMAYKKHRGVDNAGRVPYNREGIVTGPVHDFSSYGTSVTDLSWEEALNDETFIWMEFRISDRYFDEHDPSHKWYRVTNSQKRISSMKDSGGELLRGRYCQWRAHLVASPGGDSSPLLKRVSLRYIVDMPPSVPGGLEVAERGNGYIVLKWRKNVESDLLGYRIYYGTRAETKEGIISQANGSAISNSTVSGNYMTLRIDNSLVNENRIADKRGVLRFPMLENSVLYYFSVTAYDSYKPGTAYNHESELSQPVTGRPYAGSEIK